jgi:osmotically-inducible protein OsmY
MRPVITILAMGACAMSSGCVTAAIGAAASVSVMTAQERPIGRGIDDAIASNTIKTKLLRADHRAYSRIDVEVSNGQVLLSGAAPSMEHRIEAERVAWNVTSVNGVLNEIQVGPGSGIVRSAMDELITAQVRARLLANADVRGVNFNIETFNGVVYLMGVASSEDEMRTAAETASLARGAQRIVSFVQVRKMENPAFAAAEEAPLSAIEDSAEAPFDADHAIADGGAYTEQ